jgi:restriction system protein
MLPKQKDIEIPLLKVLVELGGQGRPQEIYLLVREKFPDVTADDLNETLQSGGNRWKNRVQWVSQRLINKGEMHSPSREIWTITDKGRRRVHERIAKLYKYSETSFRSKILTDVYRRNTPGRAGTM